MTVVSGACGHGLCSSIGALGTELLLYIRVRWATDETTKESVWSLWPRRLQSNRSLGPELLLHISLRGATEQTTEEVGWLGRPA